MPNTIQKISQGNKVIYLLLAIISLIIVACGIYFYSYQADKIKNEVFLGLKTITTFKAGQITEWHKERMADAKHFSNSPLYTNALENWIKTRDTSLYRLISRRNQMIKELSGYEQVFIVTNLSNKEASFNPFKTHIDQKLEPLIDSAFYKPGIYVSEPYFSSSLKNKRIAIIASIIGSNKNPVAALVLYANPADFLIPVLQGQSLSFNTLETSLIRLKKDSVSILSSLKNPKILSLAYSQLKHQDSPLYTAIAGKKGKYESKNKEFIGYISEVTDTPWIIISQIDHDEVFSELKFKAWVIIVIIIILIALIGLGIEIIGRRRIVQELIKARDNAQRSDQLKEAFLQNLSHEIRTPLNAIVGFTGLLNDTDIGSPQQKEFKSIILNSSNQLLSVVSDVLTAARIQTGQEIVITNPFFINEVIDKLKIIFEPQILSKDIEFRIHKGTANPMFKIISDETKITQILTCLLNNAVKFTSTGSIELGYNLHDNEIHFYVQDTGIGIAEEAQDLIFERFRQANANISTTYGGTGLGLSISKAFASMLNGNIKLISKPGKGSKFVLIIPIKKTNIDYDKPENQQIPPARPCTILVAEDEEYNYQLIEVFLSEINCKLLHASDGLEAIKLCHEHPDIDLILMDIKMPKLNGQAALTEIRKFRKKIPIIAQTAYALEHDKQHFLNAGFDDYIPKPIRKEYLLEKIELILSKNASKAK